MKRRPITEEKYQKYLTTNPAPFEKRTVVYDFKEWLVIKNEFPYDKLCSKHHLLIPAERVSKFTMLNSYTQRKYHVILSVLERHYDAYLVNMPGNRTVPMWWHCHLITFRD